jgi:hypothetical protein
MSVTNYQLPGGQTFNFWTQVKQFNNRGGFQNGLIPNVVGKVYYVNANTTTSRGPVGADGNDGLSPLTPLATVAKAFTLIKSYDTIVLDGVIKEQVVAPLGVYDVTILGAANAPRQATSSGTPTGGGAYWTAPASPTATTALLEVIQQGWTISNICFNPVASSPCIQATRAEDAVHPDPSHLSIYGCYFVGGGTGQIGYEDSGGCFHVTIQNCIFNSLTTAIKGVAGAGIADPLMNDYSFNRFMQNTNDIVIGCSYGRIHQNWFKNTTTQKVDLTAGGHEEVTLNFFDDGHLDIDPAHGYTGSATGTWLNYTTDQAALQTGQPA